MSVPKINDLTNTSGSGRMATLYKTKNTSADGSIKSGYYADDNFTQKTDGYQIPHRTDDYNLLAYTSAGTFRIYYDNKSNGSCHVHVVDEDGNNTLETFPSDAKLQMNVETNGALSLIEE